MLDVIQSLLTIGATGVGIYVALNGLNAWKRELTGKRDIDICQKVIEQFYEAESNISQLRWPLSYPESESSKRPRAETESDQEKRLRDTQYVPLARFEQQREFWADFFSNKYRMRALFGDAPVHAYEDVDKCLREFRGAALTKYQNIRGDKVDIENGLLIKLDAAIWEMSNDDAISKRMKSAIETMESICIPIVRAARGTPPSIIYLSRATSALLKKIKLRKESVSQGAAATL